jgi:hypothetical protein
MDGALAAVCITRRSALLGKALRGRNNSNNPTNERYKCDQL